MANLIGYISLALVREDLCLIIFFSILFLGLNSSFDEPGLSIRIALLIVLISIDNLFLTKFEGKDLGLAFDEVGKS